MEATSSKVYCSAFGTKKIAYCCDYLDNYRSAQEVMIQVIITLAIFTDYQLECQSLLIKSLHQFYLLKLTDRTKIKEMGRNRIWKVQCHVKGNKIYNQGLNQSFLACRS
jgi:hypothetical protein